MDEREMSSECSSGCQSGWTMYLDQSSHESQNSFLYKKGSSFPPDSEEEEEEEDLSMISDASSGPPHFREEDQHFYCYHTSNTCCEGNGCLCSALQVPAKDINGGKKRRNEAAAYHHKRQSSSSLLDDTASSPLFFSNSIDENDHKGELDFSCGFSATHSKGKSALLKQISYLQYSSVHVKPNQRRPGSRKEEGKKIW